MKNKKLTYVVMAFGLFILTFFSFQIYKKVLHKNEINTIRSEISTFQLQTLDGKLFTNDNLEANKNILFVFFDSGCEICQIEGDSFSKIANEFHSTHLYFISKEPISQISKFQSEKKLDQSNITFLQDDNDFSSNYNVSSFPFMCLYNQERKLINIYKGGIKPELILKDAEGNY